MTKRTSNNVDQDSMAANKRKFHDQVENSSSNDNNEKLAIKQKVDISEKRVEMEKFRQLQKFIIEKMAVAKTEMDNIKMDWIRAFKNKS
uniref:Uncharacterized protein n=1 Tax=Romanomermis culicivorax TaxID=13658 RepID=A0A915KV84_ROMCU